jgi:hypothetical protein
MKCVKNSNGGNVRRVTESVAERLVKAGWAYCPKSEWKTGEKVSEASAAVIEKIEKPKKTKKVRKSKKAADEVEANG